MDGRVVWILGAGFSRSLGGPLLGDLLRRDCLRTLRAAFPPDDFPELQGALPDAVVWLYHYGRGFPEGRRSTRVWEEAAGELLWRDAEEFLDIVDSAAASRKNVARSNIEGILHQHREDLFGNGSPLPDLAAVRGMARRLVAAECSAFLRGTELGLERWGPYQHWAEYLVGERDHVVTFNYDLVLEHLCTKTQRMGVVLPNDPGSGQHNTRILKLHGSVSWQRTAPGRFQAHGLEHFICCRCIPADLAIATPGRTKAEHAKDFSELWTLAKNAIRDADAVVFLGYRFPPSDAEARSEILSAIARNKKRYLPVHTVLGPDVQSADSARLRGLLRHSLGVRKQLSKYPVGYADPSREASEDLYDLEQQPLFVEDFLSVVERDAIFAPFKWR
jgi:hypothetical protein